MLSFLHSFLKKHGPNLVRPLDTATEVSQLVLISLMSFVFHRQGKRFVKKLMASGFLFCLVSHLPAATFPLSPSPESLGKKSAPSCFAAKIPAEKTKHLPFALVSCKIPPMSYVGLKNYELSLAPTGRVVFLLTPLSGEVFDSSPLEIKIQTREDGGLAPTPEMQLITGDADIFAELVEETDISFSYTQYYPHAYETLYSLFLTPQIWSDALKASMMMRCDTAYVYFFQDVANHAAELLGQQVGQAITYRSYFKGGNISEAYASMMEESKHSFEKGDKEKCEAYLRSAVSLAPESPYALNNLGCLLLEDPQRIVPAGAYIKAANTILPNTPELEESMAQYFWASGQKTNAVQWLEKSIKNSKNPSPDKEAILEEWRRSSSTP